MPHPDKKLSTLWAGLSGAIYLAVLPIAHTMALRNIALFSLLLALCWGHRQALVAACSSIRVPIALLVSAFVLAVLVSESAFQALDSIKAEWGRGLLAMIVGAGLAAVLSPRHTRSALHLGLVSAVPIFVFLILFGWRAGATASVPWGYWGVQTHHADIGYAAGQSVILLTAALVTLRPPSQRAAILPLILACLASTLLALSRGGFGFGVLAVLLVLLAAGWSGVVGRKRLLAGFLGLLLLTAAALDFAVKVDPRWQAMIFNMQSGFDGDALRIQCEGRPYIEPEITAKRATGGQADALTLSVLKEDAARLVVLRAGVALAFKHPWGTDASPHAYQKSLRLECPQPAVNMAHTHNAWLDTLLALGFAGAAAYLGVMVFFLMRGAAALKNGGRINPWALALFALSIFWMLRGMMDSVFRDHMLEMQGFVLAFAVRALDMSEKGA